MGSLVWLGFLAFFVASLSVGVRLVLLWRRTRQLPELLIGIGVLGIGPVGFGGIMLGSGLSTAGVTDPGSLWGELPFAVGSLAYSRGITNIVRVWLSVWQRAGGDMGRIPYWTAPEHRGG